MSRRADSIRQVLLDGMRGTGLRGQLIQTMFGSSALKAIRTLLGFVISVILARALGPKDYGLYAFALTAILMLAMPVRLGFPTLLIREITRYRADGKV